MLLMVAIIVGALRVRAQNRGSPARPGDLALKEKAALPLRSDVEDLYEMDDKNPDVIPCNKGRLLILNQRIILLALNIQELVLFFTACF